MRLVRAHEGERAGRDRSRAPDAVGPEVLEVDARGHVQDVVVPVENVVLEVAPRDFKVHVLAVYDVHRGYSTKVLFYVQSG